jgi:two-component system cell cycle sensor histidine kinase/response regulator CckA
MQLPRPANEVVRLENLKSYRILDTPPEPCFDDLTRLAAYICGTPMALIGFVDSDRQWFKSRTGWDVPEVPRGMSFCAYTILQSDVVVVSDTLEDDQLKTCPLATHGGVRFYAGTSLVSEEGYVLGTLCVMDCVPRGLTEGQTNALGKLARQVMTQLKWRRSAMSTAPSEGMQWNRSAEKSETLYQTVAESASDAIVVIDEDSTILFMNHSTERIFGYSKEELLGRQLTILMPDYLRQAHKQTIKKYVETGEKHLSWTSVELPGLHKSGQEICLEISFAESVIDGKCLFTGICRDVTQRKRAEQERLQLAAIVESSGDGIIGNDLNGVITTWNKGAEKTYGYTAEDIIGKPVSMLTPHERSNEIPQIVEKLRRGEHIEQHETVRVTKDGRRIHVSLTVSPIRDENGKIVGASTVGRDITERKLAQESLRHSEQRLQGIIGSAMDSIITVNSEQRIVVFNKAAEQMFRCAASEAIGCPLDRFIPERFREIHRQHIQSFGRTGITGRSMYSPGTLFAIRADGEEFPIEATISQVEAGGERLFTVILRDIGTRIRLEEQLRQAQKIEAVGQLAGGVAHEFNNFLGIILGYSELLSEEAGENEGLRRSVAEIKAATQHAASLTRQLLTFSRKQLLEPQTLDLNQAIWETHKLLRRLVPANINIVPLLASAIGQVKADPGQIQQILINLLVNARDAMPEGGRVVVETANVDLSEDESQHAGLQPGGYVILSVSDTGCGMDAEARSHLFEPFFTTKQQGKGTGLGLSTVYGIVKQSGGYVTVESNVGKGTTFRIYLPRIQAAVEEGNVPLLPPAESNGNETILVVEDETALRRLLCLSLERRGYTVLAAKDGAVAIEIFQQRGDQIHLVVTDIMLPHLDGFELKQRITALRQDMKFLFMSGYSDELVEQRLTLTQGCAFLEKPFLPDELASKVRDLLRGEAAA